MSRTFLLLACAGLSGCSCSGSRTDPAPADQTETTPDQHFDRIPSLAWPFPPTERVQVNPTPKGDQRVYDATHIRKTADGLVMYSCNVEEYPAGAMDFMPPREILDTTVLAFQKEETSRKEVHHGAKGHPGLEVRHTFHNRFSRQLLVWADSRLYTLSVTSDTAAALDAPPAEAFFASLRVD
jgi:hypothetical protein